MPATSIRIRVDPETARAYRAATDETKAQARLAFEAALADERERTHREAAGELIRHMDEVGRNVRARGLTPEILDDILNDRPPSPEELAAPGAADEPR